MTDGVPVPASVRLAPAIAAAIVAHAQTEAPDEACGFVVGSAEPSAGGEALRYVPCRNALASPTRYRVHADDLLRVAIETERSGEEVWAVVHSHVRGPAVPSPTDVAEAAWSSALYVLVSLAGEPSLRAWRIEDGTASEVALETAPGAGPAR